MRADLAVYVALTATCVASCGALVFAEYRGHRRLRIATKLCASTAFVLVGVGAFATDREAGSRFVGTVLAGLVLGALGDAALLGRGKQWFMAGLVAFLVGHIAYVVAVNEVVLPSWWLHLAGPWAALPVAVGGVALIKLWPRLGSMKLPVILYVITIATMVIAAIAVARANGSDNPHWYVFLAGASLFFVSDLAVARDRFVARTFANKAWGLPAYFSGQLLIAWSLFGLG